MYLWVEATKSVVSVQNKLSHSALGNKTPEEMFTGEKLEVNHLKIFGFLVYLHVPKEKRSKLDPSGKNRIFFRYSDESEACIIYIPGFHKIEVNIDVTFYEDATFNKSRKTHVDEEEQ